jgi:hypothetical protein
LTQKDIIKFYRNLELKVKVKKNGKEIGQEVKMSRPKLDLTE